MGCEKILRTEFLIFRAIAATVQQRTDFGCLLYQVASFSYVLIELSTTKTSLKTCWLFVLIASFPKSDERYCPMARNTAVKEPSGY